jgi:hypothetical protein
MNALQTKCLHMLRLSCSIDFDLGQNHSTLHAYQWARDIAAAVDDNDQGQMLVLLETFNSNAEQARKIRAERRLDTHVNYA